MKIAINCIFFQPRAGGIAEYIYNLVTNLSQIDDKNEYVLYVLKDWFNYACENLPPHFRIKTIPYGSSFIDVVKRSLFSQKYWSREETVERFDIFHSPFFHSPRFKKARVIITVHDMRFVRFPRTYTFPRYLYLQYAVRRSVKAADRIISVSNFTKSELVDVYRIASSKVSVIYEGVNSERFCEKVLQKLETPEFASDLNNTSFLLAVGHLEPRKNYMRLMEAFDIIKKNPKYEKLKLVIVGKKGHHYHDVIEYIKKNSDIVYLDFVSLETLVWLYKHATLFVFPSFYEGFGFPPLEAGRMGTASVVSQVSSMPEVCGDAVAYFDPYNIEDMASTISKYLDNEEARSMLLSKMDAHLKKYSWQKSVEQTLEIYNSIKCS